MSGKGVISGPHFPEFGPNRDIYSVNLHIQSEYRKIGTRNNSVFGQFSPSNKHYDILAAIKGKRKLVKNYLNRKICKYSAD